LNDNEEFVPTEPIELSPDFTDSNVLADLLADNETEKEVAAEASEIEDIQELDNLDFDDLLANIEEETTPEETELFEINDESDTEIDLTDDFDSEINLGSDSELDLSESITDSNTTKASHNDTDPEDDFISVDSLLSDSFEGSAIEEPYDKTKINVGLDEFPEFSGEMGDDDDDDNGIEAKLDLARVYLEIGDKENAEVILMDVVAKGDPQQQLDAQSLLDGLM